MNKETLQSYNTRLNKNNISLDDVLEKINDLPEISGTLDITENGEYDVSTYEKANVNVEGAGGKYKPRYMSQPIKFQSYTGSELEYEVSGLDTTNFTDMSHMFNNCRELTSLDLSGWNTKNVTNMQYMFNDCRELTTLNLSGFNTNNVINMSYMFSNVSYNSQNLVLDLSSFNTSKVTNMSYMFRNCSVVSLLGLSNFDTSNVTNMYHMFRQCQRLTELDLSSFDTSNVTDMTQMFYNLINLKKLDIRNFTFDKVTSYNNMFGQSNSGPIPTDCLIIVKSETEKEWVLARRSDLTNVKTVAEL